MLWSLEKSRKNTKNIFVTLKFVTNQKIRNILTAKSHMTTFWFLLLKDLKIEKNVFSKCNEKKILKTGKTEIENAHQTWLHLIGR